MHQNCGTLVRSLWYNPAINRVFANCTTAADYDVELHGRRRAAAQTGELPTLPLAKRYRAQRVDETLATAIQRMYDAATPQSVHFETWCEPGVNYIRAVLLEKYWIDNMSKTLNAWRREWRLAQPQINA